MQGDEVIVLIPEGSEDSGCVIVGRMNNAIDKFPFDSVAGQDPTTNTFAFTRRRTPMVQEFAGPILFRSALNDGLISISTSGVVTIKDAENSVFQMSPDVIGFQGPSDADAGTSPEFLLQLDLTNGFFVVQVEDAIMSLASSPTDGIPKTSTITVPGSLTLSTSAAPAIEHVLTTESLCNILVALGLAATITKATSGWLPAEVVAAIVAAGSLTGAPGYSPAVSGAILTTFTAALPKTSSIGGQLLPGIGCAGLLAG